MTVWKRASTPEEKRRLLEELEPLWNAPPDMRLGQLIYNAVNHWLGQNKKPRGSRHTSDAIFYIEDDDLLTTIALFVKDQYPPGEPASTSS